MNPLVSILHMTQWIDGGIHKKTDCCTAARPRAEHTTLLRRVWGDAHVNLVRDQRERLLHCARGPTAVTEFE